MSEVWPKSGACNRDSVQVSYWGRRPGGTLRSKGRRCRFSWSLASVWSLGSSGAPQWSWDGPQSSRILRQGAGLGHPVSVSHWSWVVPWWGWGNISGQGGNYPENRAALSPSSQCSQQPGSTVPESEGSSAGHNCHVLWASDPGGPGLSSLWLLENHISFPPSPLSSFSSLPLGPPPLSPSSTGWAALGPGSGSYMRPSGITARAEASKKRPMRSFRPEPSRQSPILCSACKGIPTDVMGGEGRGQGQAAPPPQAVLQPLAGWAPALEGDLPRPAARHLISRSCTGHAGTRGHF